MIDLPTIFESIDHHRNAYIERLSDYLRMPSISAEGIGMGEVADYLLAWLSKLGFDAQLVASPGWPFVHAVRYDQPEKPTILFYGHYDVQPPDPLEAWVSPPFEPTIRDGRIFARGAGDNKGQHFAQILGMEAILNSSSKLPCNVIVLLEGEEEVGSPHIAGFIREHRDLLPADLVVTSDGPLDESGLPEILFGVRGVASFELHARGANQDLHSGNFGNVAPNPIWSLVHLLGTMKNPQGEITIDGFYDQVLPPTELEISAIRELPVNEDEIKQRLGLEHFDAPLERSYYERLAFWPTLTINGLYGGYGGPGSKTVLPHEAFAKCDIRLVEAQSVDEIMAKVEAHVRKYAPEVVFVAQHGMEPSKTPLDSPYAVPLQQAIFAAVGERPLLIPALGASLPDYVFTKILGVPAFTVPYANADESNHAPNENLKLDLFVRGIKSSAAMLAYLGKME